MALHVSNVQDMNRDCPSQTGFEISSSYLPMLDFTSLGLEDLHLRPLVNKSFITPGWLTDSASHEIQLCTYHQFSSPGYKRTVTKVIEKLVQYKSSKNHRKLIKFIVKLTVGTFQNGLVIGLCPILIRSLL